MVAGAQPSASFFFFVSVRSDYIYLSGGSSRITRRRCRARVEAVSQFGRSDSPDDMTNRLPTTPALLSLFYFLCSGLCVYMCVYVCVCVSLSCCIVFCSLDCGEDLVEQGSVR